MIIVSVEHCLAYFGCYLQIHTAFERVRLFIAFIIVFDH